VHIKRLLTVLCFSVLAFVSIQVLSPPGTAFTVTATVDIKPDTLNLNMHGKWITAYIWLPEGFNVSDIDAATVLLQNMFEPKWSNIEGNSLMIKFDASTVINYLWDRLNHMGLGRAYIELTITGQLMDGTDFEGTDTIIIMNPPFAE